MRALVKVTVYCDRDHDPDTVGGPLDPSCGPCEAEAADLENTWRHYQGQPVVFLGVDYVDTETEARIQAALEQLTAGRTSVVVAHRLSTIRRADQILVVRGGEIVERGTHEDLLARDGLYSRLARIQNTATIEESFEKLGV